MFGFVSANPGELTQEQRSRYGSIYCGICRGISHQSGQVSRLGLSYDMAFLAMLLMSLYEPREQVSQNHCMMHPIRRRPAVDNPCIRYAADMNVALAYYNFLDDWRDDRKLSAGAMTRLMASPAEEIAARWPRQCAAIRGCIQRLSRLEREGCADPDQPAGVFGELMGELLVMKEDHWRPYLQQMGNALGRFIYLMDAAIDYEDDKKHSKYNPYLAMGLGEDRQRWETYLVNTIARCTDSYERLPLVQDKDILDNILYSGVWVQYRRKWKEKENT